MIKSVKVRFDKWRHSTCKAHLLVYRGKEFWVSKKICWDLQIAGNDMHAWATLPAFKFNELTGCDIDILYKELGAIGLREQYGAIPHTLIEHHIPERVNPVENNTIQELKK